jgi:EAL domain-containing protein (putative c-di-GMP-specific phosphodiesterase class I)
MAHSLGLKVVAEGAEDELTCAMLADAGCDSLQGYYLSPPLSGDELGRWLATKPRLRYAELASPSPLRVITGQLQNLG